VSAGGYLAFRLRRSTTRLSPLTRQGVIRGLVIYRWLTIIWASAVFSWEVWYRASRAPPPVAQPQIGFLLLGLAIALTSAFTLLFRRDPDRLLRPWPVYTEIGLGTVMLAADTWIYGSTDHPQTLPTVWVVAAVASAALAGGRRAGVATGLGMGLARYLGLVPFAPSIQSTFAGLATMVLLGISGWVVGHVLRRLRRAEQSISAYRAREEVARTLHDGVLQTLAVIQRRSNDAELVTLARNQEIELRDYLFGGTSSDDDFDLASGLRAAGRRAERRYGLRVEVVLALDLPGGTEPITHSLAAAVGEALTNATRHGGASSATIYAEPSSDGTVFVSVKDNGCGFDPDEVAEGVGLSRSIRGRVTEIGGRVEVDGRPGRGTEIRMWV